MNELLSLERQKCPPALNAQIQMHVQMPGSFGCLDTEKKDPWLLRAFLEDGKVGLGQPQRRLVSCLCRICTAAHVGEQIIS